MSMKKGLNQAAVKLAATKKDAYSSLMELQQELEQKQRGSTFLGLVNIMADSNVTSVVSEDESQEEVQAFGKAMLARMLDFIDKVLHFSEDSYEVRRPTTPDPEDYGGGEYIYESRVKAKQVCQEQVSQILQDFTSKMGAAIDEAKENTISNLAELDEIISDFSEWFSDQYDKNMNLECSTDEAIEMANGVKSDLCALAQELSETNVETVTKRLSKDLLKVPHFDEQKYFQMCKIEREDDALCFLLDDPCDALNSAIDVFMEDVIEPFQDTVKDAVQKKTAEVCRRIVQKLNELCA